MSARAPKNHFGRCDDDDDCRMEGPREGDDDEYDEQRASERAAPAAGGGRHNITKANGRQRSRPVSAQRAVSCGHVDPVVWAAELAE